ncbi:extra-cytoplasmic solute receptor [Cupriavidus necator N-1]|uniref:Extra-cytoplasmic solute receptor n=1 Tax=Cupriavidus necator (strain ATCC 43291 / DSM 13513 / CCUG 52238 / LMG 8453 / N-1) TaxID=1042878 RepID=F8GR78_CUPNN|nr:tripartite tricarboxylate transporter substrate binding protein [Cupriavidus necator]AEI80823.1 extra-cytoplasmic solute receptor [Cupriavidus necator N-1]KAI3608242.1 BUG/TctC family periplasmic protein [Cupriavidus necator H850]MDX6009551.1 tripartite tricarboxylate transporter substrate binding protein [Cupriavidus necator]
MTRITRFARLALAGMLAATALGAAAQAPFPTQKPISLVVPFAPGGGNDILARLIAPKMGQLLGQTIVIENKPGAGGNLGADYVAHAAPDGYTLVIASSQVTMNPFLGTKIPFSIERDFEPVGRIASVPIMLVANPNQPFRTLQDFIQYTRANPGKLSYSSPGNGTPQHLAGEVFAKLNKTELLHVPYRGTGPSITDLMGGQVQISFATFASAIQYVRAGKLRALGIAGKTRTALMPDLPTFAEAGMAGYDAELWYSLLAPARTPKPVVDKINAALVAALKSPDVAEQMGKQGFEPQASSPAELKAYIGKEMARWQRLIRDNGIKVAL